MDLKNNTGGKLLKENLVLKAKLVLLKAFMLNSIQDAAAKAQMMIMLTQIESTAEPTVEAMLDTLKELDKMQGYDKIIETLNEQLKDIQG